MLAFKESFRQDFVRADRDGRPYRLKSAVHQDLKDFADITEVSILKLAYMAEMILQLNGQNVTRQDGTIKHYTDGVLEVYTMVANLARANTELKCNSANAGLGLDLARYSAIHASRNFKDNYRIAETFIAQHRDHSTLRISEYLQEKGMYCFEHPMKRNIF